MNIDDAKISPAFEPLLASGGPNDRFDAIVLFRPPEDLGPVVSRRRRRQSIRARLARVKQIAEAQTATQKDLVASYLTSLGARSQRSGETELNTKKIGSGVLPVTQMEVTSETVNTLASDPNVLAILPNQRIELVRPTQLALDLPNESEQKTGRTWGLEILEIPKLWERSKGEGITVAVLDTGVHDGHPALEGRVHAFMAFDPLGRRIKAEPAFDSDDHGTHVCGTIAGGATSDKLAIGVAPGAGLVVGAVLIGRATLVTLLEGLSWAVESGADVINMSLGFPIFEPRFTDILDRLIDQFGVVPVVSVGNESHGNTRSPGNAPSAFSVGAAMQGPDGSRHVAAFSSGASLNFPADAKHKLVHKPDVVAPGQAVYSSIPPRKIEGRRYEYAYMNGTSMAAPHVSGAVALLMAIKPDADAREIMHALRETAWHPSGTTHRPDNRWGYGIVRPAEAVNVL